MGTLRHFPKQCARSFISRLTSFPQSGTKRLHLGWSLTQSTTACAICMAIDASNVYLGARASTLAVDMRRGQWNVPLMPTNDGECVWYRVCPHCESARSLLYLQLNPHPSEGCMLLKRDAGHQEKVSELDIITVNRSLWRFCVCSQDVSCSGCPGIGNSIESPSLRHSYGRH